MQFLIMGLLHGGPLSLYDVHKRFTGGISLFYAASFGSIQRALSGAQDKGWVTVEADPRSPRGKKLYEVTSLGRQAWRAWMKSAPEGANPESTMLARIYLVGLLPVEDRAECLAVLRSRVETDATELSSLASRLDSTPVTQESRETFRYQRATLDYGIQSHALALKWLDDLELAT